MTTATRRKEVTRVQGKEFCTLEVELRDRGEGLELSICGTAGDVVTRPTAKREAREFWVSYFEDNPGAIIEMNQRCGSKCRTAGGAAKFVINTDGEFHGLDVHIDKGKRVYVAHSCGQIREELTRFFPEVEPYFKWHLNHMNAACEHQEELGWGRGKDVAILRGKMTLPQRQELWKLEKERYLREAAKSGSGFMKLMECLTVKSEAQTYLASQLDAVPTWDKVEALQLLARWLKNAGIERGPRGAAEAWARQHTRVYPDFKKFEKMTAQLLDEYVSRHWQGWEPESKIYKDSLGAPCPTCGYRYGTAWLKRELPQEVIDWFDGLKDNE